MQFATLLPDDWAAPDGAFLALEFVFLFVLGCSIGSLLNVAFIGSPGKRAFCGR